MAFDGGVELRVKGRHKGMVVQSVFREAEPRQGPVGAAYLGDDQTDEDAFAALAGRGLGVLVREQYRPTKAQVWLRPPKEMLNFLHRWHETVTLNWQNAMKKT